MFLMLWHDFEQAQFATLFIVSTCLHTYSWSLSKCQVLHHSHYFSHNLGDEMHDFEQVQFVAHSWVGTFACATFLACPDVFVMLT